MLNDNNTYCLLAVLPLLLLCPPPSQPGSIMLQGPTMDPRIASELLMRLPHLHLRMAEHCRRAAAMAAALSHMGAKVGGMLKKLGHEGGLVASRSCARCPPLSKGSGTHDMRALQACSSNGSSTQQHRGKGGWVGGWLGLDCWLAEGGGR